MESISRGAAAYKVIEEIRDYSQLRKQQDRLQKQIFMSNMIMTTRQQALVSLNRLQTLGVTDMEIKNMAQLMTFDSMSKDWKHNNEREAFELIKYKIVKAVRNILTEAVVRQENPRTLAVEMSKQVVYRVMLLRKGTINVAREAFERSDKISV